MTLKKSTFNDGFYVLLVFLFFYIPYVDIGIVIHLPYMYPFLLSIIFCILQIKYKIQKELLYIFILFVLPYLYVVILFLLGSKFDVSLQLNFFNAYLTIIASFGLAILIFKKYGNKSIKFFLHAVFISGFIHAVIMVLAFFIEPFRTALYSIVILGSKGKLFVELLQRSPGLTTGGGDGLSVIQSIAFVFGIYIFLINYKKISFLKHTFYYLAFLFLLLSLMLSARTGFVILFFGIFLMLIRHIFLMLKNKRIKKSTFFKSTFLFVIIAISIVGVFILFIGTDYARFITRALEAYLTYERTGNFTTTSTSDLSEMYFFPTSESHLIGGDGNFGREESLGFIDSDVGYIRVLWGGGILGLIFFYLPIVLVSLYYLKKSYYLNISFVLIFLTGVIFAVNFKVYHLYSASYGFKIFVLMLSLLSLIKNINMKRRLV